MQYRGHILIVFALSLIMSPYAIRLWTLANDADSPKSVRTVGAAQAECADQSAQMSIGRVGCIAPSGALQMRHVQFTSSGGQQNTQRRVESNGALFVTIRK